MEPGFKNGKIILDNGVNSSYYPGQVIHGIIEFNLKQQQNFSSISVQYVGEAQVHWKETSWKERTQCNGREEYFNIIQAVLGGNAIHQLASQTHRLPFTFQLPRDIPPTFNGDKGCVWYRILALADAPGRPRETIVKQFTVVSCLDLNDDESCQEPMSLSLEGMYGGCACAAGAVRVAVRGPRAACPGQTLPLEVCVDNRSGYEVNYVVFTIVCTETYHSASPRRSHSAPRALARLRRGPVLSRARREFTAKLPVPALLAVDMTRCRVIDVVYSLQVTVKMTGNTKDLVAEREMALGLVPLRAAGPYEHPCRAELPPAPPPAAPTAPAEEGVIDEKQGSPVAYGYCPQGAPPVLAPSPPSSPRLDVCYSDGPPSVGYQSRNYCLEDIVSCCVACGQYGSGCDVSNGSYRGYCRSDNGGDDCNHYGGNDCSDDYVCNDTSYDCDNDD